MSCGTRMAMPHGSRALGSRTDHAVDAARGGPPQERLGGARADFVATLGRRVADLQGALLQLREDPASAPAQGELLRRMHALAASARLLRFAKLGDMLAAGEGELELAASAEAGDGTAPGPGVNE